MVYRGARRRDIATQGKATADDLHMGMNDRTVWDASSHYSHDAAAATQAWCHRATPESITQPTNDVIETILSCKTSLQWPKTEAKRVLPLCADINESHTAMEDTVAHELDLAGGLLV